jgi:hypothetical protein
MPSGAQGLRDRAIRRHKSLGMAGRFAPWPAMLPLARRSRRVLAPVREIPPLAMLAPWEALALGRAVALQLVGNDDAGHVGEALEELAKKLLGGLLMTPALDQEVEHMIVLIHRTPPGMALAVAGQKHRVHMPRVTWSGSAALQLLGSILPQLPTPGADSLLGHVDAALEPECWHVAGAQREAIREPDAMADALAGEAGMLVAFGVSGWSHGGCFS